MNGVSAPICDFSGVRDFSGMGRGLPATSVFSMSAERPLAASGRRAGGQETLLAAVTHPPRGGEPRPLAALVPEVLARYGLGEIARKPAVDLVA